MRVALYVRVSTQEQKQNGLSVVTQIDALKEYCKENNYTIVDVYNDAGISGHITYQKRPELLRMIKDCQDKKVDLIIMTKLDRFFRSVKDYYAVMEQIGKVPWRAIWEDYETETSSGIFKVNIMLSVAQAESDRTSERIKAIREYQRENGMYTGGTIPLGYKPVNKQLVKDTDQAPIVEEAFRIFLTTKSYRKVIEYLQSTPYPRTRNGVYMFLRAQVYAGDYWGHKVEPYITQEQHDEIIRALTGIKRTRQRTKETYLFSGLIKCPVCGNRYAGSFTSRIKNGEEKHYIYYFCSHYEQGTCTYKKNISEKKLEKYLLNELDKEFELYNARIDVEAEQGTIDIESKINSLEARLTRIGNRYEDGDISREEYRSKRDAIKEEIEQLKATKPATKKQLPSNWRAVYDELDKEHRKSFWLSILEYVYLGEEISIKL